MNEIDEFLERARSEGTLHSEGSFSLDVDRAKRLLDQYQFSDPNWYLLKLVQAAVACGASEINMVFRSDCVQVTILGNDMLLIQTKDVLEIMLQREQFQQGALKQLAIGLNAALAKSPERVEWSVWNPFLQEVLTLDRQNSSLSRLRERPQCLEDVGSRSFYQFSLFRTADEEYQLESQSEQSWIQKLGSWLNRKRPQKAEVAEDHHRIAQRCQFTPITVRVDGRIVNQPDRLRKVANSNRQIGLEVSVLDACCNSIGLCRYDASPKHPHLQVRLENAGESLVLSKHPNWTKGLLSAHLICPSDSSKKKGQLIVVHYGVTLEELESPLPDQSIDLILSSEGLGVDLSEQSIIKNELLDRRTAEVYNLVLGLLEKAPPQREGAKVFLESQYKYMKHPAEYRTSLPERYKSPLCQATVPFFAPILASLVPDDDLLDVGATTSGLLSRLGRLDNTKVRLELPEPGLGQLTSPANVWPAIPPGSPVGWLDWVKGAIHCVANNDFYKFSQDNLLGPYLEGPSRLEEGVVAEFWPDQQLRSLYYQSSGQKMGWILTLAQKQLYGTISHATDSYQEIYQGRQVRANSLQPRHEVWYTWVNGWIEAVYRDALW